MIEIVKMEQHHVPAIAQLEKMCFSAPWSENSIAAELSSPLSCWFVAVEGERVLGYIGSQSVQGESDMMNLAVHPDARRRGIGELLVQTLSEKLRDNGNTCLTLEVRESNTPAIILYEKLGFSQVGKRPNYYHTPKEAALIMRRAL